MSRRQLFLLAAFFYSLLVVFLPSNLTGGSLVASVAFLVVNVILADLLWIERAIFPIYLALLGVGGLLAREVFGLATISLELRNGLFLLSFWLLSYLTILSLNVLNVATVRTVPLRKVALSFIYYLGIILGILFLFSTFTIFHSDYWLLFLIPGILSIFLAGPYFYFSQVKNIAGEVFGSEYKAQPRLHLLKLAVLAFIMGQMALVLPFWPASVFVKAIFAAGTLFILITFFQGVFLKKTSSQTIREFLVVWAGLFLMLMVSRG